jgi:hypothetical protein
VHVFFLGSIIHYSCHKTPVHLVNSVSLHATNFATKFKTCNTLTPSTYLIILQPISCSPLSLYHSGRQLSYLTVWILQYILIQFLTGSDS